MKTFSAVFSLLLGGAALFPVLSGPVGFAQRLPIDVQNAVRAATVEVRISPDRPGWTYAVGEVATFRIAVTADNQRLVGASIRYTVGPEMMPADSITAILPKGDLVINGGTMKEPGFLRCIATVNFAGKEYRGQATAGFSPDKIRPTQKEPADFMAFWTSQKTLLAKIPLDPEMTLQPDLCISGVDTFHVSFANVGGNTGATSRIYGMLSVPKGPGPYPAVLRVPGAGVRPYRGFPQLAAQGIIVLEIGIHGIPVNLAPELYTALAAGALHGYTSAQLDDRERYYYRRVYLGCVRANDFLTSLPQFDGKNLGVWGGSQGGQLSLVTAALDPRVTTVACMYPAYADVTGYLHGRAGGWPGLTKPDSDGSPNRLSTPKNIATTGYYDVVNFARYIKSPGIYSWGYNDDVCPPTSVFAAYNVIAAPKQLVLAPERGHVTGPEQGDLLRLWFLKSLGVIAEPTP